MKPIVYLFVFVTMACAGCGGEPVVNFSPSHVQMLSDARSLLSYVRGNVREIQVREIVDRNAKALAAQRDIDRKFEKGPNIETLDQLIKAAEAGYSQAQLKLGVGYLVGPNPTNEVEQADSVAGLPLDLKKAEYWLIKTAERGNIRGAWILANNPSKFGSDIFRDVFWLAKISTSAGRDDLDLAVFQYKNLRDLKEITRENLETFKRRKSTMPKSTGWICMAFEMLERIHVGVAPWGDRNLTDKELNEIKPMKI